MVVEVATDAKQVLIAAIPAVLLFIALAHIGNSRLTQRRIKTAALVTAAVLFVLIFSNYTPLQQTGNESKLSEGSQGKFDALAIITDRMGNRPETFIVGPGPGNT